MVKAVLVYFTRKTISVFTLPPNSCWYEEFGLGIVTHFGQCNCRNIRYIFSCRCAAMTRNMLGEIVQLVGKVELG